jgi:hypothetical protein
MGEPATLSVIGLGKIDEFEVEAEGPSQLIRGGKIKGADAGERLIEIRRRSGGIGSAALWCFGLATGDGGAAKGFDRIVDRITGLLAKDFAEKHAKRADIASQRSFLEFASRGLKLGEALGPVGRRPKGRHD